MTGVTNPITKATRIAVLCGGLSGERDVSLRSGKNCYDALHRLGYEKTIMVDMDRHVAERLVLENVEAVFLALHGKYGEDGCIQGLLEILGIPYTGNGVMASALTMNKDMTKKVLRDSGLPVIPSITVKVDVPFLLTDFKALTFPVMVKPISEGSSIGMNKVNVLEELPKALLEAGQHSNAVMVEEFVVGKSITVGVIHQDGHPIVTPILELRTKTEWYDLEAKYTPGLTEFILPAELDATTTAAIQTITLQAHQAAGCYGVSRVDFVVAPSNQFFILEINTIPGMTNLSDLPAQAECMGITYDALVEYILQTATLNQ